MNSLSQRVIKENRSSIFLIISACLLLLLSFGFRSSFGLFVTPISEYNSWGREVISMALAIQNLSWGIIAVFAGGLADRFGNTRVVIGGTFLFALGMLMMAGVDSKWVLHGSAGLLVGAGIAGTSFGIVLPAMARAVDESKRQMVLGIGTAAGSLGQFIVVPVTQQLINGYGWITTLNILAASALTMVLLAIPLAPYSGKNDTNILLEEQTIPDALEEALKHRSYILLVSGFFVCGFHVAFITAHMPAFLSDQGFSSQLGAWSLSIIGFCNIGGAFLSGLFSGRIPKRSILVGIYTGRAIAIALFMLLPLSVTSVIIFSAVMGFLWLATVPPTSGLVAVMFGTRYMALLYGIVFLGHQLGSFCGVWLGGWLYDMVGSYDMVWWMGVLLSVMAAIIHYPIEESSVPRLARQNAVAR